ncbi:hypothetical protein [uncultured Devosia sp.]|uniref:hypothetical protein n=1 Tax=uncultured Devosia sp. TaxID=211434 RepID=UPI0035CA8C16
MTALAAELERQGIAGFDVNALADAVENVIAGQGKVSEGRHPDELNATNDD